MKDINITKYDGVDMNQLLAVAGTEIPIPETRELDRTPALPILLTLQNATGKSANFEYFEQIQQIPFYFLHGSSISVNFM